MKYLLIAILLPMTAFAAPTPDKVRICFSPYREELVTADLLLANAKGFFKEQGIDAEMVITERLPGKEKAKVKEASRFNPEKRDLYLPGTLLDVHNVIETSTGACDIASTALENIMLAKIAPNSVQPLAMYLYGKNYDTHLLVRAGSKVKQVKDLKGKTIRIGQIGTRMVLSRILKEGGLTLNDVKLAMAAPDDIPKSLASGKFEAVIAYNPTTPLLLAGQSATILTKNIYSTYMSPFLPHSTLIVSSNFKQNRPAVFAKFMNAFRKAAQYLQKNPVATVDALTADNTKAGLDFKYGVFPPSTVQKSASFFNISEPYYIGEPTAQYTNADIRKSILNFHNELVSEGFLTSALDTKTLEENLRLNAQ